MSFPRPDRRWLAGLLLLLTLLLSAATAGADALDRARMVPMIGSERLRLFTLGRALETGRSGPAVTRAMRQAMTDLGFYHQGTPAVIRRDWRASPVLAWDSNINGGYMNDRLDLFGLVFEVDPANMARAGLVAGARVSGDLRWAWSEGRYLQLSGSAEAVWSPRHDIGRASAGLSACSRNHVGGWVFADLCASTSGGRRSLSSSYSTAVTASLSRLFATDAAYHQLSFSVEERWQERGEQASVTLGWAAVWNRATTDVSLTLAQPIDGESATRARLTAEASWYWGDRTVTASLWHLRASGGMLLGMPREDNLSGIGIAVEARPGMIVELTHQVTRSSIDLFDEARTGVTFRLQLDRFR